MASTFSRRHGLEAAPERRATLASTSVNAIERLLQGSVERREGGAGVPPDEGSTAPPPPLRMGGGPSQRKTRLFSIPNDPWVARGQYSAEAKLRPLEQIPAEKRVNCDECVLGRKTLCSGVFTSADYDTFISSKRVRVTQAKNGHLVYLLQDFFLSWKFTVLCTGSNPYVGVKPLA